jgi:hypothetical protein
VLKTLWPGNARQKIALDTERLGRTATIYTAASMPNFKAEHSRFLIHATALASAAVELNFSVFWVVTRRTYNTDVSGVPVDPIFKSQSDQQEDSLTLEDGTDRQSRNVGFRPM